MPRTRSWLFVPGDSERKIEKALRGDADRIVLDLEDAVAPQQKSDARAQVREVLLTNAADSARLCVRINPLDTDDAAADLSALADALPRHMMLPKVRSDADLLDLDTRLTALEAAAGAPTTEVIALVTETASMTATLPAMQKPPARVTALTWGGEDLSAVLGASANRYPDGRWLPVFEYARTQCLLAARRYGLLAIDTLYSDFRDSDGMRLHACAAVRDGFDGVLAIHPAQIEPIHAAYAPDATTVSHARAVVAAFDKDPDAGAVQLDGKMLDRPHLTQAKKILQRLVD